LDDCWSALEAEQRRVLEAARTQIAAGLDEIRARLAEPRAASALRESGVDADALAKEAASLLDEHRFADALARVAGAQERLRVALEGELRRQSDAAVRAKRAAESIRAEVDEEAARAVAADELSRATALLAQAARAYAGASSAEAARLYEEAAGEWRAL